MPYKIVDSDRLDSKLTELADKLRAKNGTTEGLDFYAGDFSKAADSIPVPKPEQEKTIEVTANGDHDVIPDEGKVLSKATVKVRTESADAYKAELSALIDESGVLDSTEGTAIEKVGQLIDKAEFEKILYDMSVSTRSKERWFEGSTRFKKLPKLDYSQTQTLYYFLNESNLEEIDYYIDSPVLFSVVSMLSNTPNLKRIVGVNVEKVTDGSNFMYNSSIEEIDEPFNPISIAGNRMLNFNRCNNLRKISFVAESIKYMLRFTSAVLTAESVQSIIDGLAPVETTTTIYFNSNIVTSLTDEQLSSIANKNWTVG